MTSPEFYKNYYQVIAAIESCLANGQQLPALILIYSLIDSFAWIVYGQDEKSVRKRFETWCEEWVIRGKGTKVSATDLYAARCAILHTLTSDADLTTSGKARRVVYAWGTAESWVLENALEETGRADVVVVHINDFFQSVREAIANVLEFTEEDAALALRFEEVATRHFKAIEPQTV